MNNIDDREKFLNIGSIFDEFDRTNGRTLVYGLPMPQEFIDAGIDFEIFKAEITKMSNLKRKVFRFSKKTKDFLRYKYRGNKPNDLIDLMRELKYSDEDVDLIALSEDSYKKKYPEKYDSFFNKLSKKEQEKNFVSCDYGARSVFEMKQDVFISSKIVEQLIIGESSGVIRKNEKSSGGNDANGINKKSDFIFSDEIDGVKVDIPIELKTKWESNIDKNVISVRGGVDTVKREKGMYLCVYVNLFKKPIYAVLVDAAQPMDIESTMIEAKKYDEIKYNEEDMFKFDFWKKEDMEAMIEKVHYLYRKRNGGE